MRALIVDDSRTGRMILSRIMTDVGFAVDEARNGAVALALISEGLRPDIVLIDWNMPVMTGIELVEAIRRLPENDPVRLMMVTTETDEGQVTRAMRAGADEYVTKPCTRKVILEKLRVLGFEIEGNGYVSCS